MRQSCLLLLFASLLLLPPAQALAYIELHSEGGFLFDFSDVSDFDPAGSLSNGSIDAYDGCYNLSVAGTLYDPSSGSVTRSLSDRQLEYPPQEIAGLTVWRIVYVPESSGNWARYLEVLENTGSTDISTTVRITGNFGSDGSTVVPGTSSGDTVVSTDDIWFATDDSSDGGGDPSLAHVVGGESTPFPPSVLSLSSDSLTYEWNVTVPAGGRVAILHYAIQTGNREASMEEARRLVMGPDDAFVGLDDYLEAIKNWQLAVPGAPRVRFSSPYSAEEGEEIVIEVSVEDLEGDDVTFSWDLDNDGTFGEAVGMTHYTVPAGTTDGPSTLRVGVEASDSAGNVVQRYRTVAITNVAPTITSQPPLATNVGSEYRYQFEVEDPAGDADPPEFTLVKGPARMSFASGNVLTWMPTDADVTSVGETISVEVLVSDGDGGTATQKWELSVSPNRIPTTPVPVYPTNRIVIAESKPRLVVENAQDLDLDDLTYFFEIDTVETFDSPDIRESGPIEETPGLTVWQLDEPLEVNRLYYWRVWANDGTVDSAYGMGSFMLVREPGAPLPDAGVPVQNDAGQLTADAGVSETPEGGGGCSVGGANNSSPLGLFVMLSALGIVLARRRTR